MQSKMNNAVIIRWVFCPLLLALAGLPTGCSAGWPWEWKTFSAEPAIDQSALVAYGNQSVEQGNLQEALKAFEQVLAHNPNATDAHIGIGDIYKVNGDYETAARKYASAVKTAPANFQANFKLALMYHLLNRVRQAIDVYLTAIAIDPNSFDANLNIATAYLQIDQAQMARPYAEKALSLNPKSQHAYVNLGSVYSALGMYEEAIVHYRSAAEYGELDPPIAMNLVNSFLKLNYYHRAINTLVALNHRKPSALNYERLGYAWFKLNDLDKALDSYNSALRMEPGDTQSLNGVGVCLLMQYMKGGQKQTELRDQAIASWQKSLRLKRDQPNILQLILKYQKY